MQDCLEISWGTKLEKVALKVYKFPHSSGSSGWKNLSGQNFLNEFFCKKNGWTPSTVELEKSNAEVFCYLPFPRTFVEGNTNSVKKNQTKAQKGLKGLGLDVEYDVRLNSAPWEAIIIWWEEFAKTGFENVIIVWTLLCHKLVLDSKTEMNGFSWMIMLA